MRQFPQVEGGVLLGMTTPQSGTLGIPYHQAATPLNVAMTDTIDAPMA